MIGYKTVHNDFYNELNVFNYFSINCVENISLKLEALRDERFQYSLTLYLSKKHLISVGCLTEDSQVDDITTKYVGEASDGSLSGKTDIYYSSNIVTISAQELNEAFALHAE